METYMQMLGRLAKNASRGAAKLGTKAKNRGLLVVANELVEERELILQENAKDIEAAKAKGVKQSLIDRLALTEQRIEDMAEGLRQIAALDDPIGEVLGMKTRPNGLRIGKKRVPLGVVGIIIIAILKKPKNEFVIEGEIIDEKAAPTLWDHIKKLCKELGISLPDRIIAGIDDNFFVTENPSLFSPDVPRFPPSDSPHSPSIPGAPPGWWSRRASSSRTPRRQFQRRCPGR